MRKILALLLILALCLPCAALGEGLGEYDGPEWTFGVSLKHLHYAKLKIVSPAQPADASYVPEELEALRARRNDDHGNNINIVTRTLIKAVAKYDRPLALTMFDSMIKQHPVVKPPPVRITARWYSLIHLTIK